MNPGTGLPVGRAFLPASTLDLTHSAERRAGSDTTHQEIPKKSAQTIGGGNCSIDPYNTFTARAATTANVSNDTLDAAVNSSLDRADSGIVSVGLNAVAAVNATNR